MNIIEAYAILRGRLGNRAHSEKLAEMCLNELRAAQQQLEDGPTRPWFLLKYMRTPVGSNGIAQMPANFLNFVEATPIYWYALENNQAVVQIESTVPITEQNLPTIVEHATLEQRYLDESLARTQGRGSPYFYVKSDNKLIVYPNRVENPGGISFTGYFRDTQIPDVTSRFENDWLRNASICLITRAGTVIAGHYLGDDKREARFGAEFNAAMDQLTKQMIAYEAANIDLNAREIPGGVGNES